MAASSLRDRRVLVVEDEWLIAKRMSRDLAAAGAVVIGPVASVDDALVLIAADAQIHAAVLDVNLRGETCFPVADALLARGIPFVFATGYADGELDARYPGVLRSIKPVEFRALEQMLTSAL